MCGLAPCTPVQAGSGAQRFELVLEITELAECQGLFNAQHIEVNGHDPAPL